MKNSLPILPNSTRKKGFIQPFLLTKKHSGTERAGFTPLEKATEKKGSKKRESSLTGFTLIEMLVVSVILVILMGSLAMVFLTANKSWTQSEAKLQIYQNAREALSRMSREIACAFQPSDTNQQLSLTDGGTYLHPDARRGINYTCDKDELIFTAALNDPDSSGEYDLTHLGYRLRTAPPPASASPSNPILQRYKKDYDTGYDGSSLDSNAWKEMAVNIISLSIECYDGSSWVASWSSSNLPEAVKVTIKAQDKQERYEPQTFESIIYIPTN